MALSRGEIVGVGDAGEPVVGVGDEEEARAVSGDGDGLGVGSPAEHAHANAALMMSTTGRQTRVRGMAWPFGGGGETSLPPYRTTHSVNSQTCG